MTHLQRNVNDLLEDIGLDDMHKPRGSVKPATKRLDSFARKICIRLLIIDLFFLCLQAQIDKFDQLGRELRKFHQKSLITFQNVVVLLPDIQDIEEIRVVVVGDLC